MWYEWRPYVPAARRRRKAEREVQKRERKGQRLSPVVIEGRTIARTFWGKAWCDNLERYSDFSNRLPRGRTYVRNGSVLDLQIAPGEVQALVSGTDIYQVVIEVSAVPKRCWASICTDCAGAIDSLVELLQGRFSAGVMQRICQQKTGLFPAPAEIRFSCSCPDWAAMCKHVAAVLYGIGARLDEQPELLFRLRKVHEQDLLAKAGSGIPLSRRGPSAHKVLGGQDLSQVFGLEIATGEGDSGPERRPRLAKPSRGRRVMPRRSAAEAGRSPKEARRAKGGRRRWPPSKAQLEALIAEALVDAYGDSEQCTGFYTKIGESLALPFDTKVHGAKTTVERMDFTVADEIVAVCRRGAKRQRIPILDLPLPKPRPAGAEWIEAYRRWVRGV